MNQIAPLVGRDTYRFAAVLIAPRTCPVAAAVVAALPDGEAVWIDGAHRLGVARRAIDGPTLVAPRVAASEKERDRLVQYSRAWPTAINHAYRAEQDSAVRRVLEAHRIGKEVRHAEIADALAFARAHGLSDKGTALVVALMLGVPDRVHHEALDQSRRRFRDFCSVNVYRPFGVSSLVDFTTVIHAHIRRRRFQSQTEE